VKIIRKFLSFSALVCTAILLVACDYEYDLYHEFIREETEVEKIELITYDGQGEGSSDHPVFDSEKLEVLDTLDADDIDAFLVELSEIGGFSSKRKQVMDSPNGKGIRLTYIDGGFTLITISTVDENESIFFGNFDASENIERFYGIIWPEMITDFKTLIFDYFEIEI
jgi:hypothetical protein